MQVQMQMHARIKHIEMIFILFTIYDDQIADTLTNPLCEPRFLGLKHKLMLLPQPYVRGDIRNIT